MSVTARMAIAEVVPRTYPAGRRCERGGMRHGPVDLQRRDAPSGSLRTQTRRGEQSPGEEMSLSGS